MPTALITGATAGIGAAFARRLAADGFGLVLNARDEGRLSDAAARLREKYRVEVEVLAADLATDEGLAAVESRVKTVDLLINNAGFGNQGTFLEVPVEDELRMLRVHCEAVLRFTYAALPGMIERGRGGIINMGSVAAFFSRGTYGASKAWVVSFSQGVAQDLAGKPVRVMAMCPGFVHTEFHERAGMDVSGIPGILWLDADRVVADALRDLRKGLLVSVPGAQYKTLVGLGRLVPRNLAGRLSSRAGRSYD
ncbi:SDR family NAD(P)-dependent oxidoreductase [Actinomadura scrupuli]|uniref:SDR family NAD(P)-dependent oxidoreductase n=1 Tax=Actinomadura scrupuli TaxID=559629 RepID=UPI003D98E52D